ncbi:MAG: protein-glutamate O-methyltransferase [Desulfarculus sp.]|nr:protein-glutamate O-methyltransferase [Desulfarculus sp.]
MGVLDGGLTGGFQLTEAQFSKLASLVYRLCGIHLGEGKRELLRARLAKRLRATGCRDVQEYIERLEGDRSGHELVCFLDVITTNKTDFFREPKHFEFLVDDVLPKLDKLCHGNEPLRIWSAACSTGEEPYTLAMVLMENRALWERRGAGILASDLSTKVLEQAQNGVYAQDRVADIPRPFLTKYFQRGTNRWAGYVRVRPELRKMIQYRRLNLMDNFDFDKPFHVIFCRNVMIYFDKPTQERLVEKFRACLVQGGYLMVGHSESLTGIHHRLAFTRPAVYRRQD